MTILQSFILGLVQGLTEFLPISSSGHLILTCNILGVTPSVSLELALHVATLCAVLIYYRKQIFYLLRHPLDSRALYLLCSTGVTVVLALTLRDVADYMQNGRLLPLCFMLTAAILLVGKWYKPKRKRGFLSCLFVGAAQGIAVIPELSRSGLTITAATLAGEDRQTAAENSFLLSVPIIAGGFVTDLFSAPVTAVAVTPVIISMATAFITGLISIKLVEIINKKLSLSVFSIYLAMLSVALIIVNGI